MEANQVRQTSRPLQRISWAEKTADKNKWFKRTADYHITNCRFYGNNTSSFRGRDLSMLYNVYNNKFPSSWFSHFTNPLSAQDGAHKKFPAKIRPTTILRSNIDLLMGEYPNRPFAFQVTNLGESGYNEFLEQRNTQVNGNLHNHFYQRWLAEMEAMGQEVEEAPAPDQVPLPDQVDRDILSSYKDKIAVKGQKWMTRAIQEYEVHRNRKKMFKDWVIAGEAYSFKGFVGDTFKYHRVSPLDIDYDKSPDTDFIEDGEWVVRRKYMTLSEVVDDYYHALKPKQYDRLEAIGPWFSSQSFYDHLSSRIDSTYIPVYHVQWKGVKKIQHIAGVDPETGQPYEDIIDENDKPEAWETVTKVEWVNEVYECTRILDGADDLYVEAQAAPVQRNALNNFSYCKLNYNGKKYSDTHSVNISVLEMGIPFQILYIIVGYVKEKMLAKSKGNILLFDKNAIPKGNGWNEEKFFYYLEAMNIGLLSRHQTGVDRSWNQYTTMNMSQLSEIEALSALEDHIVLQWDNTLGINRQRKGQTYTSDGQGVNERAVFQSSVVTDMVFSGFEEFMQRDMQGILDYGKFINASGLRALYNGDLTQTEMLKIDPEDFANAELGLFMMQSKELNDTLNALKSNVQALLQNGAKGSTIIDIYAVQNLAELKQMLLKTEDIMEKAQLAQSQQDHKNAKEIEALRKDFLDYEALIKDRSMNAEYDRKEQLEDRKLRLQADLAPEEVTEDTSTDAAKLAVDQEKIASAERIAQNNNATQIQIAEGNNETQIQVARMKPKLSKTT